MWTASPRLIGSILLVAAAVALGGCATAPPAPPPLSTGLQGDDVDRYWEAVRDVCMRGVTPEMRALYAAARQAVAARGYGAGANSNFWGIRDPDASYEDCRQSPGWE